MDKTTMLQQGMRKAAGMLARWPLFSGSRRLYEKNKAQAYLPLTQFQKLSVGVWMILHDYAAGEFPPRFSDRQKAMEAERTSAWCIAGKSAQALSDGHLRKPFWYGKQCRHYLADFSKLEQCLEQVGLAPPATVLELGCGAGWMSEFLVLMGYQVLGTTISEFEVAVGQKRIASLKLKHPDIVLEFIASPMETVHEAVAPKSPFDAVIVYEALHHAFDWRQSIDSAFRCLRPGGWFLICGEPNVLHVFKSYRIARLTNTHEIGFSRRALLGQLRACGFKRRIVACSPFHFFNQPHWILAQK